MSGRKRWTHLDQMVGDEARCHPDNMERQGRVMTDPNMIYPGDARHPCAICGGRSKARHFRPCSPVPVHEAYTGLAARKLPDDAASAPNAGPSSSN